MASLPIRPWVIALALLLVVPAALAKTKKDISVVPPPDLLLDGGRKLVFERTISSEQEVRTKRGFWARVVDVLAGAPDYHTMVAPYSIAVDSHGRVIVTDPGVYGFHIFDFAAEKYKFVSRYEKDKDALLYPQCVAVDAQDHIYVTDSRSGKILVFDPRGKFVRAIGSLKGGEGYFKRPTGIAVDSAAQRIYVSDTLRNRIFILDMQGNVLKMVGQRGTANGEFNFPTELRLHGQDLVVVDAMNFRIQVLDRSGEFQYAVGKIGEEPGSVFRPKGIGFDSEGHLYLVDGMQDMVQVFDQQGRLLYYFGKPGAALGEFQLPAGLQVDGSDRIYVVDSYNRRVQVFRYYGIAKQSDGGKK